MRIYLNKDWLFNKEGSEPVQVNLPHTNIELPYNYFSEELYQFISIYQKELYISKDYLNKHLFLTFEGALHQSQIYINDVLVLTHNCGYDMFKVDIKDYVKYDDNNIIKVILNSKEDLNIPPFGKVIDYLTYGGLYRDVYLDIKDDNYIVDAYVKTQADYQTDVVIKLNHNNGVLKLSLYNKEEEKIINKEININDYQLTINLGNEFHLWDIDDPYLYKLKLSLIDKEKEIDNLELEIGIRYSIFKTDGFYLNNKLIKLIGLNRHQSFPYVGYAMPESMQRYDAVILKKELGVNAVRLSHYMQSKYFLSECDRLGLLVFIETPGWQYLGDETWQEQVLKNTENMVLQNRNHPSIILWSARINESVDCHDLYLKTNEIIHKLDNRQTGGVRCYTKGETLEDVYTYNDFSSPNEKRALIKKKDAVKDLKIPYFVSEFNGHMYPTKSFDSEKHRENQMLRYARIYDLVMEDDEILGAFGWCMFDYNTHKDFGSGDKICYHGVMDMFRNPKLAAHFYHTMNIDDDTLVLSSTLKPGDHPASTINNLYCLTSADKVRLYRNEYFIKEFSHDNSPYKHLKNSPILIDDFVGNLLIEKEGYSKKVSDDMKEVLYAILRDGSNLKLKYKLKYLKLMLFHKITYEKGYELYGKYIGNWGSKQNYYKFEAIKNDKVVKTLIIKDSTSPHLDLVLSSDTLINNHTYDVISIRIRILDENEQLLSYINESCEIIPLGPIDIIGPKIINIRGGMGGTYLKSRINEEGVANIIIKFRNEERRIKINIINQEK